MKLINDLKESDLIMINKEQFQVLENTSLYYHTDVEELEMVVELINVKHPKLSPNYRLTYFQKNPDEIKFFKYVEDDKFEEIILESYEF